MFFIRSPSSIEKFVFLPPATKLGQGYIFTGVCDSVHRGSTLAGTPPGTRYNPSPGNRYTPWIQVYPSPWYKVPPRTRYTPPGPGTPPGTRYTQPQEQCMLGDTGKKQAVHILLECILVIYYICYSLLFYLCVYGYLRK